jgi:hypothetical protein
MREDEGDRERRDLIAEVPRSDYFVQVHVNRSTLACVIGQREAERIRAAFRNASWILALEQNFCSAHNEIGLFLDKK